MYWKPLLSQPETKSALFLLSASVFLLISVCFMQSFTLTGYIVASLVIGFTCRKLASGRSFIHLDYGLTGKVVIITGASSGIGRVVAVELAKLGAKVILGIRGERRAKIIAEDIQHAAKVSPGKVIGYNLDLSDLTTIKSFVDQILEHEQSVDILVNNAGILRKAHSLTVDGFESHFGINHLGHFYLTQLLLPLLIQSKARIIAVSCMTSWSSFDEDRINYQFPLSNYHGMTAYSKSKLAQIWHVSELQRHYGDQGITAFSLHPGVVNTHIWRESPKYVQALLRVLHYLVTKTPFQGAQTVLYCCLADNLKSGVFYADCHEAQPVSLGYNEKLARECWDISEKMIKEKLH
ncbi:unnamed protein product [Didymodactylos carnosus]|uniref:Uncharacterized protein n=1 Tax=Didymodactylos carnosus TaxID=1234261 RepID=A0A814LVT1_9BILA|nr:unnamed protein product [Didymodactylos carnosus]CAF1071065.1 unnamed protein product [Didymodactylos carnosus]CAF3541907.1 unnamed protein product [Didymodactylos carnosus]CAF3838206.1 unnamed protein product [Didymodactylos carnosus]